MTRTKKTEFKSTVVHCDCLVSVVISGFTEVIHEVRACQQQNLGCIQDPPDMFRLPPSTAWMSIKGLGGTATHDSRTTLCCSSASGLPDERHCSVELQQDCRGRSHRTDCSTDHRLSAAVWRDCGGELQTSCWFWTSAPGTLVGPSVQQQNFAPQLHLFSSYFKRAEMFINFRL